MIKKCKDIISIIFSFFFEEGASYVRIINTSGISPEIIEIAGLKIGAIFKSEENFSRADGIVKIILPGNLRRCYGIYPINESYSIAFIHCNNVKRL